jgi:hypothetical protein
MRKTAFSLIIFFGTIIGSHAQSTDLREVFLAAESYYLFEEFDEALPLYLRIHRQSPDNDNVNFKIGVCYLNNPYEKSKSVFYLEKSVQNINLKYKDNNYKETAAPLEALFFLGNAYRINLQFDKARDTYNKFLEQLDPDLFDEELVREQIKAVDAAESLMKRPVDLDYQIFSDNINTRFADINAVISGDERHMVYVSRLQFYDALFYIEKVNGEWSYPRNIIPELGVDGDVYPTCISWDGSELYLYRNDDFIGNIYVSKMVQGKWTPIVKLNENINTKYWESHASINKDGNKLYFTSNRKGGFGGLDIYVSERRAKGDWEPPLNLGPVINTKYNEETPFITGDGKILYFSSYGHYNMGGYDVFVSILKDDGLWAEPRNLGYPVNTADDDFFYHPYRNGQYALYSRYKEEGFGRHDIYAYQVYSNEFPRMYQIAGLMDYSGEKIDTTDVKISVIDIKSKDTITTLNPDQEGTFRFKVPAGSYDMAFNSSKFNDYIQRLEVSQNTPHAGLILPGKISLTPFKPALSAEELDKMLTLRDTLIYVDSDKTTRLRFNAERGSNVIVNVYNDSLLISSETIDDSRRRESFEFTPQPGTNIVEFTVTDKDGNTVIKRAEVIYDKQEPVEKPRDKEEKTKDETSSDATADQTTALYKNILQDNAEGNLKTFLQNTDLEKEGLNTGEDILSFLRENADKNGFTQEDINRMIEKSFVDYDLDAFLQNLARVSTGNLKSTLQNFNPEEKGISSPYDLTEFLLDNAELYGFEKTDLIHSLGILASGESNNTPEFLQNLEVKADGKLKQFIPVIDPALSESNSPGEMAVHIYNQSGEQGFDSKDFARLLTEMAVMNDLNKFRDRLAKLAGEELKNFLNQLNLDEAGIKSTQDLIKYLYDNADRSDYTTAELDKLLSEITTQNLREIESLHNQLISAATGPLLKFLNGIDLKDYSFNSREEYLNFLYANADKNGYTKDDVNYALLQLENFGHIKNIISKLIELADGNLKKTLLNLDPEKENIKDFSELIQYLLDNTKKFGYSEEDVHDLLKEYLSLIDAELFHRKLISLSEGDLNKYLRNLSLSDLKISSRQDLINHLLKEGDKGIIDKPEIINLMLKALEIPSSEIIPVLKSIGNPAILKLLELAEKDKSINTADQVFGFMMDAASTDPAVSQEDVLDLFTDYLQNYEFSRFVNKLTEKAEGGLKEVLQQLDPKKEGIKNISDLVDHLLSKRDESGYASKDVFTLIQSLLNEENLLDFIQRLLPYTYGNLRKYLETLNLGESGINTVEELIQHLLDMADKYNYDPEEVWNAFRNMMLSDDDSRMEDLDSEKHKPGKVFLRNLAATGGVLTVLGLIILFLVLRQRKKKKEEERNGKFTK